VNGEAIVAGPVVTDSEVTFRLPDSGPMLAGVRLLPALSLPEVPLEFSHADGLWTLRLRRPPVWRMEYRLQLRHADGSMEEICDPGNPLRAPGAFGDKSVTEFPDYRAPVWLKSARTGSYDGILWSPADTEPDEPLPLLVAHDGPEYDRLAGLTWFCGAAAVPRHRVLLLAPGDRNDEYSANPAYTRRLIQETLPALKKITKGPVIGMGASLGGLAMLHAQRRRPGVFGGLYLQSASFFDRKLDPQESGFSRFTRVVRFVEHVGRSRAMPVPVTITCGQAEENLANNRQMAGVLSAQDYPVRLVENPDAHNYVGWRDTFDPALAELMCRVWEGE
jgi:enterochelin esterase-like enzyme